MQQLSDVIEDPKFFLSFFPLSSSVFWNVLNLIHGHKLAAIV